MRRELIQVSLPSANPAGSTKACFADLETGTVGDLVETLLHEDGLDIVAELACEVDTANEDKLDVRNWGLQRVTLSEPNRRWSDEELLAMDTITAILDMDLPLLTVLPNKEDDEPAASSPNTKRQRPPSRNFSDFTLTAHLQVPLIRLVYLPFRVEITLTHVPEIPENFKLTWYIGGNMTASQVIDAVLDELGIRKIVTQGSKSARVEYTISANGEVLQPSVQVIARLQQAQSGSDGYRLSFSVSDAWFARIGTVAKSFSRALQRPTLGTVTARRRREDSPGYPSGTTPSAWRPASIFSSLWQSPTSNVGDDSQGTIRAGGDSDDEDEGEGTLKGLEQANAKAAAPTRAVQTSRGNTRLSSLFDVWSNPVPPASTTVPIDALGQSIGRNRIVSEPMAVDDFRRTSTLNMDIASLDFDNESRLEIEPVDIDSAFESMMDQLGIKENQRTAMRQMDDQRKRFLIAQQQQKSSTSGQPLHSHRTGPDRSNNRQSVASYTSPTTALAGLKRFSLWSTGTVSDSSSRPQSPEGPSSPIMSDTASVLSFASRDTETHTPPAPLLQTATGWSSWFSAGSPAKPSTASSHAGSENNAIDTPIFYISQIVEGKLARAQLAKHLIALRVRLATAALSWIQDFLQHDGLAALEKVLRIFTCKTVTATGRDGITEMDESIQTEAIRCLRIILNTESGFEQVLKNSNIVTQVTFSLQTASHKLRTLAADVLAAICVLSSSDGHKLVIDAFSDFTVTNNDNARFEYLVKSICPQEDRDSPELEDEAGLWEYRAAGMALISALANSPDDLDGRMLLRDEFARRGLNETMTTLRYLNPPDALSTQLAVYMEEKQEDQEEYRERHLDGRPAPHGAIDNELSTLIAETPTLLPELRTLANSIVVLLTSRKDEDKTKEGLTLVKLFAEQICTEQTNDDTWLDNVTAFLAKAEPILGRLALVTSSRARETADVPSSFLDDLLALRKQVEQLSDERDTLASKLSDKIATGNALQALSPRNVQESHSQQDDTKEGMSGVIQRLVAKEKEVLQLQKDVAALRASRGRGEDAETAKKERAERNRQWANLMEEISKNKAQLAEFEALIEARDKEIKYLKRALESVYTRFQAYRDEQETLDSPANAENTALEVNNLASRTLEALAERDRRIVELSAQIASLQSSNNRGSPMQSTSTAHFKGVIAQSVHPSVTRPPSAIPMPPPPPPMPPRVTNQEPSSLNEDSGTLDLGTQKKLSGFGNIKVSRQAPKPPGPPGLPRTVSPSPAFRNEGSEVSTRASLSAPVPPSAPAPPPPPPLPVSGPLNTAIVPRTGGHLAPAPPPPPPPPPSSALPKPASNGVAPAPPAAPPSSPRPLIKVSAPAVRAKLKPFFWNKIVINAKDETIWTALEEDEGIDLTDVVKDFAVDTKITAKPIKPSKTQVTSLLPLQRAQNIAIMLARMRMEHSAIRDAVLRIDDRKMTIDRLKPLKTFVPTAQETTLLKDYTGDFSTLSPSDHYMRTIMTIPRLEERLTCMITRRRFEMDLEEIRPELSILRNAADEIRGSAKFRAVLKTVRAIGNALNASTFRGNARGFQLEALLKLRDTRATSLSASATTSTLLHYVARLLLKQDESLIQFLNESPHVHAASRMSAANLSTSISTLNQSIEFVKEEVLVMRQWPNPHSTDRFIFVMQNFVAESEPAMSALNSMSQQLDRDLSDLLRFFGEDPSSTRVEDFFGVVSSFAIALQKAEDEIRDAERLASKGVKANKRNVNAQRSIGRGQFDETLRDLRSGTGIRRVRQEASMHRPRSRIMLDGARR